MPLKTNLTGVVVSLLTSSAVNSWFKASTQLGQTKDYNISICCFSAKFTPLKTKSKSWLAGNQDNVCEWSDTSLQTIVSVSYHY